MTERDSFDITGFLPYLLNQAAEAASKDFQPEYRKKYGMLRTEWRVLFHLGRYGQLTAKTISERASLHKTKVSRAVSALQSKRYLTREEDPSDGRAEQLSLTREGARVYGDLIKAAATYDAAITADFTPEEDRILRKCLMRILGGEPGK